jgi:hypothetical protein
MMVQPFLVSHVCKTHLERVMQTMKITMKTGVGRH